LRSSDWTLSGRLLQDMNASLLSLKQTLIQSRFLMFVKIRIYLRNEQSRFCPLI
jgi:hypothetical protein